MTPGQAALVGVFLGVLMRQFLPYLRRLKEETEQGKPLKWNHAYTITGILALLVSGVATMLIVPTLDLPQADAGKLFPLAFTAGWGASDLLNQIKAT